MESEEKDMCQMAGCSNHRESAPSDLFFYSFPTSTRFRKKWMTVCGISDVQPFSAVCGDHFGPDSFIPGRSGKRPRLVPDAVPKSLAPKNCRLCLDELDFQDPNTVNIFQGGGQLSRDLFLIFQLEVS